MSVPLSKSAGVVSPAPSAQAVGSPLPVGTYICDWEALYTSVSDPSTMQVLLQLDTTSSSCGSSDTYSYSELSVASGTYTSVFVGASITQNDWVASQALYSTNGTLSGYLIQEGSQIVYYPGSNYGSGSSPTVLETGVNSANYYGAGPHASTYLLVVYPSSGNPYLVRVNASGTATQYSYPFTSNDNISGFVQDANYFYVIDTPTTGSSFLIQFPWTGNGYATYTPSGTASLERHQSRFLGIPLRRCGRALYAATDGFQHLQRHAHGGVPIAVGLKFYAVFIPEQRFERHIHRSAAHLRQQHHLQC